MQVEVVSVVEPSRPPLAVVEVPEASLSERYPNEVRRWTLLIGIPMLVASASVALAFGTSLHWLFGGALVAPFVGGFAIIYLAISSDTEG